MAVAYFPSLDSADVIEVEFVKLDGGTSLFRLLVDTGFSGRSSIILGAGASEVFRATLPTTQTSGAIKGPQDRAWVTCRISAIQFQATVIAIVTDLSALSLPVGIEGMIGLTFLRLFARWGAERVADDWRFFLHYRVG